MNAERNRILTYSIAIRTLGTSGVFKQELESLHKQTIMPEKIVVYIAEGYQRPSYQIGVEEYVWVRKGLVTQRALQYREIDSDYILLLDDDVVLQPDSAEKLLKAACKYNADVVGADTFCNQDMPLRSKFAAIVTNWVTPHYDQNWAFKIRSHGSFSYLNNVKKDCYPSQSCAGPASLWKKTTRLALHAEDETYFDTIKHMTEDQAMFGKVYINGYSLYVHYNSGILHLDERINSKKYDNDPKRAFYRSRRLFVLWWRVCYEPSHYKFFSAISYSLKVIWLFLVNIGYAMVLKDISVPKQYWEGIIDGWRIVHGQDYLAIPKLNAYHKYPL